jgi:hypothetical protein
MSVHTSTYLPPKVRSRDTIFDIVTILRAGKKRNCGSIPDRKNFSLSEASRSAVRIAQPYIYIYIYVCVCLCTVGSFPGARSAGA